MRRSCGRLGPHYAGRLTEVATERDPGPDPRTAAPAGSECFRSR
jgi:hypothetical protein